MMSYKQPETADEYRAAGYVHLEPGVCRGPNCRKTIQWWHTPGGKRIPLSTAMVGSKLLGDEHEALVPHWVDCPDRDNFRRK